MVSIHGVCHIGLVTDGVNGSWLCLVSTTRKKSEETDTARQELGRGQRVFHVGGEGVGRALWCLQFNYVPTSYEVT